MTHRLAEAVPPPTRDEDAADARMLAIRLTVNGVGRPLLAPAHRTLLEVLREDLGLTGTKHGCELGECGACTVLVDGRPRLACLTLIAAVQGRDVTTVEGLGTVAAPHPLQAAFVERGAAQCGYCTGGMLLTAAALLEANADPSDGEVRAALAGNLCRCTGYASIVAAVRDAARAGAAMADAPQPRAAARSRAAGRDAAHAGAGG